MSIGGYHQLSLVKRNDGLYSGCLSYQSARAALYALLKKIKPNRIYLPNYLCDSILPAIGSLNIQTSFYDISDDLLPKETVVASVGELIMVINYFGIMTDKIKDSNKFKGELIVDNSQALFSEFDDSSHAIYSPRKFLAVPDGGFLKTNLDIEPVNKRFNSNNNINHLIIRAVGSARDGYSHFLKAERALEDFIPKRISKISEGLMKNVNLELIKRARVSNYNYLYSVFNNVNQLKFPLQSGDIPLCYPLMLDRNVSCAHEVLIAKDIFLPRYWDSEHNGIVGCKIYNNTLFLPIDERITDVHMLRLCNAVKGVLNE